MFRLPVEFEFEPILTVATLGIGTVIPVGSGTAVDVWAGEPVGAVEATTGKLVVTIRAGAARGAVVGTGVIIGLESVLDFCGEVTKSVTQPKTIRNKKKAEITITTFSQIFICFLVPLSQLIYLKVMEANIPI
jgi:hypothetical protein